MCGLWGVVAKNQLTVEQFNMFRELGVVSTLRGYDSSGVALASRTKKRGFHYNWFRDVQPACNLVWDVRIADFFNKSKNPLVLMGHARWATIGSVTTDNAHPFRVGNLLGMHNGTIPCLKEKDRTDSEVLYEQISLHGVDKTIAGLTGQKVYALTWFDLSDGTFNVLRNHERPLFYMYSVEKKIMVYASDDAFLKLMDARYPAMKFAVPIQFEMDNLYSFKHGEIAPTKRKVRDYVPFVSNLPVIPEIPWRNQGNPEKRALMEQMQKQTDNSTSASPTSNGSTKEDSKTGKSTITPLHPVSDAASTDNTSKRINIVKEPPVIVPDTEGVDYMSVDSPFHLFRSKMAFFPPKILVNKVIKHLRYRMYDGAYSDPLFAIPILADGCAYSGQEASIRDRIVWISSDSFVLEEFMDIPFVTEALAASGYTSPQIGGPFYLSLPRMMQIRKERRENGLPF